jgi:phosphatidylglycerol:prolipoprotein diacylglycerol transferase
MRSVLIELGPWSWAWLPMVWIAVAGFVLLWQGFENRSLGLRKGLADWLGTAVVALMVAVLLMILVNRFAPLSIKSYGVMMLMAFVAGTVWTAHSARKDDLQLDAITDIALLALIGGIVGSRVAYVLLNLSSFANLREMLDLWSGGLSFHGGLLGALIAAYLYCLHGGYNYLKMVDQFTPGIALGYSFARIGCFLNGCCHGVATELPWAVTFPPDGACVTPNAPVHPTQLYAAVLSLFIFIVLTLLRPRLHRLGHLFLSYVAMYSVMRFALEFTRAGATARILSPDFFMTEAQLASIILFIISVSVITITRTRQLPPPTDKP